MIHIDREKFYWKQAKNQTVVFCVESGVYYILNETASLIWEEAVKGLSLSEIAVKLSKKYGQNASDLFDDGQRFLTEFAEESLVVYFAEQPSFEISNAGMSKAKKAYKRPSFKKHGDLHLAALGY